jgi:low affinity Fe/Cu permease
MWLGRLLTRQCLSTYEAHNLKNIRGSQAVRDESDPVSDYRHVGSRVLHALDRWATKPTLALSVVTAVVVWVLYSAVFGFPARLETIFQTLAAATTLAMVFVIQHTQARAQAATQRKLDEILLASPEADNTLITLEEAPDNELKAATDAHRDARRDASQESPS